MAAGEGRRMLPVSERWAKPVLPVDGRPVVATLLRALAGAGVEHAVVVTGHLAEQVEALLEEGGFGLGVGFVRQPTPDGSADTVRRALAAGARPPLVVAAADTVFGAGDIARFLDAAEGADGAIAVRRSPPPGPGRPPAEIEDGRIVRVLGREGELSGAPLWFLSAALLLHLEGLPGPPFELAELFQRGVDAGLAIAAVEIGKTRDLTTPIDLVRENHPYLDSLT
jgi:NDP-sugar pyrophosphorylase family protein